MLPPFPTFWANHVHGHASVLDSPSKSWTKPQKLTTQVNFESFSPQYPPSLCHQPKHSLILYLQIFLGVPFSSVKTEGEGEPWNQVWTPSLTSGRIQQQIPSWGLLQRPQKGSVSPVVLALQNWHLCAAGLTKLPETNTLSLGSRKSG